MDKITIETDFFLMAFEDNSYDNSYYLDVKTGKIIFYLDDDFADNEISYDEIENNPDRYIDIESLESHESFRMMEIFADNLTNEKAKSELLNALSRGKPFRQFKDTLYNFPDIQEKWYTYHENEIKNYAQDWLKLHKIDAELK